MWLSLETASWLYDAANVCLIIGLTLGVASTVLVVWTGTIKEEYLTRDVAAAHERAAQAEQKAAIAKLELEKLKAPRLLNEQQMESLSKAMIPFKGYSVSIGAKPYSFESVTLGNQIEQVLKEAQVLVHWNQGRVEYVLGVARGVVALSTRGNEKGKLFAVSFARALNDSGIAASVGDLPEYPTFEQSLAEQHRTRNNDVFEAVDILIGDKI